MKSNNNKKNRQINTMFQRKQGGDREYLETLLHIRGDLSEKLTCEIRITHTHTHPTVTGREDGEQGKSELDGFAAGTPRERAGSR